MAPLPVPKRLQVAMEAEFPGTACDEAILTHMAASLEGDRLPSADDVVESWAPFLISLGTCSDDEEAHETCRRLLARLRHQASADTMSSAEPTGGSPGPSSTKAKQQERPPMLEGTISEELATWLEKLRLVQYADRARAWCGQMGAVNLNEVLENWEEFVDELKLKPLERKRVEKDVNNRSGPAPAQAPGPPASPRCSPAPVPAPPGSPVLQTPPTQPARSPQGFFGPANDLKKYALLEELGQGATATVYRCQREEAQFAVKTISLAKLRLQRDYQRITDHLNREVQILFKLRHPRIVSLFDVVEETDKLHLVMELVEGGPEGVELFDYIVARGSFTEPVARYVFLQLVDGLQFIHSRDIVYRDLKPENILVDEKASKRGEGLFEVKLSDFGHSKLINDGYSTALTRVGTPQYWAPEVNDPIKAARGYDQTVDLWSLGVVLYVMLIGSYPFDGVRESVEEQIRKARFNFQSQASGRQASPQAQDLIRALIRVEPRTRLQLDACRTHRWVAIPGGPVDQVMTHFDQCAREERVIHLPIQPSKQQVDQLRRDLHIWMKKWKTCAQVRQRDVVANFDDPALGSREVEQAMSELHQLVEHHFGPVPLRSSGSMPGPRRGEPALAPVPEKPTGSSFRLLHHVLRVSPEHGAGLDLEPERGGMRITGVCEQPGQPGLLERDLIIKIDEISLRGNPKTVVDIFGAHFTDGAQLAIKRAR